MRRLTAALVWLTAAVLFAGLGVIAEGALRFGLVVMAVVAFLTAVAVAWPPLLRSMPGREHIDRWVASYVEWRRGKLIPDYDQDYGSKWWDCPYDDTRVHNQTTCPTCGAERVSEKRAKQRRR